MSRPLRLEYSGALWHTVRGNERKAIYRDDEDRRDWLELLGKVVGDWGWKLHAYVLMLVETERCQVGGNLAGAIFSLSPA